MFGSVESTLKPSGTGNLGKKKIQLASSIKDIKLNSP